MEIFAVFRLMAADVGRCRTRALDDSGQRIGSAARPERSVTPPQATDGAVAVRSAQGQTSSIAGTGVNGQGAPTAAIFWVANNERHGDHPAKTPVSRTVRDLWPAL
jgi:hypothetical protein